MPVTPARLVLHEVGLRDGLQMEHASVPTERKIQWDPKAERITNDENLNRLVAKPMRSPWKI